jgi:hypothetical protein
MKRLMVGGLALGFTAVGTLALGGPAGAQEEPEPEFIELAGQLSADSVAPGEEITATPADACSIGGEGELWWYVWSLESGEDVDGDVATLEADGTWSVTFQAPDAAGDYEFDAYCAPTDLPGDEEEQLETMTAEELATTYGDEGEEPTPEEPTPEEPFTIEYYALGFTVDGGDGPPVTEPPADTPAPPVAAPAQPVVEEPDFTG